MPSITGTVRCLQVSDLAAFTMIQDGGGNTEVFILYFAPGTGGGIPDVLNSFTRILHSMWVSLLREAISNNLSVTIQHPNNSAEVTLVRLGVF